MLQENALLTSQNATHAGRTIIGPRSVGPSHLLQQMTAPSSQSHNFPNVSMATGREPERSTTSRLAKQMVTLTLMCWPSMTSWCHPWSHQEMRHSWQSMSSSLADQASTTWSWRSTLGHRTTPSRWQPSGGCSPTSWIQDSRLFYYLIREIKMWLNMNYITVHNNTYLIV